MFSPRSKGVLRVVAALALLVAVFSTTNVTWAGSPVQSGVSGNTAARPLMQGASGFIQLNCQLNNSGGVNITVTFNRPGPPPSNIIVTLTLLDGSTETQTFANTNSLSFSGAYANIDVQATWPDGATGYATGDCSSTYPTPTPVPATLTPTVTNTPGPTNTPRPTNTPTPTLRPGEPTLTPRPTNTPRPTVTPGGPTLTPEPASPTPDTSINITIDCDYFSDTDRQFIVTLVPRAAGPPSGTAILALVAGGTETQTFTTNSVTYRGAYLAIRVNVSWPDGATATGGNSCGLQIPNPQIPPTVTPPATPTTDVATATPPPASTPTSAATAACRDNADAGNAAACRDNADFAAAAAARGGYADAGNAAACRDNADADPARDGHAGNRGSAADRASGNGSSAATDDRAAADISATANEYGGRLGFRR